MLSDTRWAMVLGGLTVLGPGALQTAVAQGQQAQEI